MKALTPSTVELIRQLNAALYSARSIWSVLKRDHHEEPELLRAIGASGEPAAIPHVLQSLLDARPDVARAAEAAVHRLYALVTLEDLPQLDYRVRGEWRYQAPAASWYGMPPETLGRLERMEDPVTMLGLASFHPNGRIREPALNRLDRLNDDRALPFFLIRLNDWVEPVRAAAERALEWRLRPEHASTWVRYLSLVLQLGEYRTATHKDLVQQVLELLKRPECRPALHQTLDSTDPRVRRAGFRLLLEAPGEDASGILERMLFDEDPIIRTRAAERMDTALDPERLHELLPRLERDPWTPVRRAAMELHAERWPDEAQPVLERSLLDAAQGIRDAARFYLRQSGERDFRAFYRNALSSAKPTILSAALTGLAEVGSKEDVPEVIPFLSHPVPKVRRAAVRTLDRLDGSSFTDSFLSALSDESIGVSRTALEALQPQGSRLAPERVWEVFAATGHPHVRRHALALMQCLGRWRSIPLLVRAAALPDPETAETAKHEIRKWHARYNTGYARPTMADLQQLSAALDDAGPGWQNLRSLVAYWSR